MTIWRQKRIFCLFLTKSSQAYQDLPLHHHSHQEEDVENDQADSNSVIEHLNVCSYIHCQSECHKVYLNLLNVADGDEGGPQADGDDGQHHDAELHAQAHAQVPPKGHGFSNRKSNSMLQNNGDWIWICENDDIGKHSGLPFSLAMKRKNKTRKTRSRSYCKTCLKEGFERKVKDEKNLTNLLGNSDWVQQWTKSSEASEVKSSVIKFWIRGWGLSFNFVNRISRAVTDLSLAPSPGIMSLQSWHRHLDICCDR